MTSTSWNQAFVIRHWMWKEKKIKKPWWNIIPECHTQTSIPLSINKIQVLTRSIRLSWILFSVVRNLLLLRPSPVDSNWKENILLKLGKESSLAQALKWYSKTWACKEYVQLTQDFSTESQPYKMKRKTDRGHSTQHCTGVKNDLRIFHEDDSVPFTPIKHQYFYCYSSVFDSRTLDFLIWVMSLEWCLTTPPPCLAFTPHPSQMVFTPSNKISCNYQIHILHMQNL